LSFKGKVCKKIQQYKSDSTTEVAEGRVLEKASYAMIASI